MNCLLKFEMLTCSESTIAREQWLATESSQSEWLRELARGRDCKPNQVQ